MVSGESGPKQIRDVLERLYVRYNRRELIKPDPLQFVYRYSEPADMEIAGFLAAALAYGRVGQIERSVGDLLSRMGASPREFVADFDGKGRRKLKDFKHRFTSGDDISDLLELLRDVLSEHGSIEAFFASGFDRRDVNTVAALTAFCERLLARYAERHGGITTTGLKYLLASPARGSASKRLHLFLRWMVREDDVDAGLWKSVDKAALIVPIDVHMGRLCRILGLYKGNRTGLSMALKITEGFAKIEPGDPVRYDFSLSRIGIIEECNGRYRAECELCELFECCMRRESRR